jgi:alkylation response protein AidB-like acyl-CoA dehydrogenase
MDFAFSEEQEAVRDLARQISAQVTQERLKEVEAGPDRFDRALWTDLAEANLLGIGLPHDVGGSGFGIVETCLVLEELGRVTARVPAVATLAMTAPAVAAFGSPALRDALLPGVVAGDVVLTAALVEPGGDDPTTPATTARRVANEWRIEGSKICVPAADIAARVLVPANTDDGVVVAAVDPKGDGVRLTRGMATSGLPEFRIELDGVVATDADVLGDAASGTGVVQSTLRQSRVGLCALQIGIAERALELTAEYTSGREQFGRPIAAFQAVGQRAADAYIDVEAARLTMWQAAWRLAEGLPSEEEIMVAKFWAAEAGQRVCAAAQHLHGGIGVDLDYPLHRYTSLAKHIELSLGAATPQLVRLGAAIAATATGQATA